MSHVLVRPMSILLLGALALSGCSGKAPAGTNGSSATAAPAAGLPSSSGDAAPAWATAAGPSYPNNVLHAGMAVPDHLYQIDTADDYETVAAWYRSHLNATWSDAGDNKIVATVGNVEVSVEKNGYWHDASQPKTMIGFFRRG